MRFPNGVNPSRGPWLRRAGVAACMLVCMLVCCRGRQAPPPSATNSEPRPGAPPPARAELAALLLIDEAGASRIVCLPSRRGARAAFPGLDLLGILDVAERGGKPWVAALTRPEGGHPGRPAGRLVLLSPGAPPRVLADDVHDARFSPAADALAFETGKRKHVGGGIVTWVPSSHLVDLATGKVALLGEDLVDARWEADGQHLRASRLAVKLRDRRSHVTGQWLSSRVRWARASGALTDLGPGAAQLPAPRGTGLAFTDDPERSVLADRCPLLLGHGNEHPQNTFGPFCQGSADDRGTRWSPDGRWLALTTWRARPSPDGSPPLFLDVVAGNGERHPAFAALASGGAPAFPAAARGFPWLDWSPSQRYLVAQDGDDKLWLYDLVKPGRSPLGQGRHPRFSPAGSYLLARRPAAGQTASGAFVLSGDGLHHRDDLGTVRDERWLPAAACTPAAGQ